MPTLPRIRIPRVFLGVLGALLTIGAVLAATVLLAVYTRPNTPVVGLPAAPWGLVVAAAVLVPLAAIWPWLWLSRQLPAQVGQQGGTTSGRQRLLFGLALLAAVGAMGVLGPVDGLLRGLHAPGETSAGVTAAIGTFTGPAARQDQLGDAVKAWSRFVRPRPDGVDLCAERSSGGTADMVVAAPLRHDCNAPITVLIWHIGIDTAVLIPAYAVLLGLLLVWGRRLVCQRHRYIKGTAGRVAAPSVARVVRPVSWALLAAVIADWLENVLAILLATDAWTTYNAQPLNDSLGLLDSIFWSSLLTIATWAKWAGIVVVVGYLLGIALLLAQHGGAPHRRWAGARGVVQTLLAVRVQLLVVAVFGGLLLLHEQVPDVIRRWTDEGSQAVGVRGVLITILLALTVWRSGRWMVRNARPGTLTGRVKAARRCAIIVIVLSATAAPLLLGWSPDMALAVPVVLIGALAALSKLLGKVRIRVPSKQVSIAPTDSVEAVVNEWLGDALEQGTNNEDERVRYRAAVLAANPNLQEQDGQLRLPATTTWLRLPEVVVLADRPGLAREVLPRLLASAVIAILGLAMLRATVGLVLFNQMLDLGISRFLILALVGLGLLLGAGAGYWLLGQLAGSLQDQELEAPRAAVHRGPWHPVVLVSICLLAWWTAIGWMANNDFHGPAQWFGVIGVVGIGLLLLLLTTCGIVALPDRLSDRPAAVFRVLGLRRTPVMSLLVVWFVVVSVLPLTEGIHDVRPALPRPGATTSGITLEIAFQQWQERNCIATKTRAAGAPKQVVPLILVASSGGGIRAAAWTSQVLDRAFADNQTAGTSATACQPGRPNVDGTPHINWVFAASGVSGGSLGLAGYAARLTEEGPELQARPSPPAATAKQTSWWRERLDEDSLAASLSWMLFVETPWSWLRFHADRDRAEVLEETWERAWQRHGVATGKGLDQGFFSLQEQPAPKPRVPLLLFNGTSVESGCRFNASMLRSSGRRGEPAARCLAPRDLEASADATLAATIDLADFICADQQPRLSTAVLLSARFPVISPSGHLQQPACARIDQQDTGRPGDDLPPAPETFVVDGGYLENSGADTAVDLSVALAPLIDEHNQDSTAPAFIVPVFIQIDNGYAEPAGPGAAPGKPQFVTPLLTVNATRDGRQADARQGAQVLFGKPYLINGRTVGFGAETTRYVRFSLLAHPGPRAPTGWTLSDTSFDDLEEQFRRINPPGDADTPLERVRRWFKPAQVD